MIYENKNKTSFSINGKIIKPGDTVEIDGAFNMAGFEEVKGEKKKNKNSDNKENQKKEVDE